MEKQINTKKIKTVKENNKYFTEAENKSKKKK